ncbi:MAG: hypothetical protein M1838_003889 [Thelocarpon superellum]|nr:MAG: hypothetical protein M1838_003889 [Thelocarpon superellum]
MNRSIEQALAGLAPAINGPVPAELVELATSLLAQSRSKASNLRENEEIARTYACANIACERMKQSLNLPDIQPRPPCPPKIYQGLYKHLDSVLGGKRPRGRPRKSVPATPSPAPVQTGPSAERLAKRRPGGARPKTLPPTTSSDLVPPWIMPTIRHMCTSLGAPAAPPHVLAGVTSILTLPVPFLANNLKTSIAQQTDKLPALLIAVYSYVSAKLRDEQATAREFTRLRQEAMQILRDYDRSSEYEAITAADVDAWMREIYDRGWTRLDWFENIDEGSGLALPARLDATNDSGDDEEDGIRKRRRTSRNHPVSSSITTGSNLGTMMQSQIDYLSEARRLEYDEWEKDILEQAKRLILTKAARAHKAGATQGT